MKHLMLGAAVLLTTACAKSGQIPGDTTSPAAAPKCALIDTCTYGTGFNPTPVYDCKETTYQSTDTSVPAADFQGKTCLITREDWHTVTSPCGPMNAYSCSVEVQGPGPQAL